MLVLRRLKLSAPSLSRANASLQSTESTPVPPPPPATAPKTGRRWRVPIPPKRPSISLSQPRKWNRPLAPGVIPAYDLALELIRKDSQYLTAEARVLGEEIEKLEANVAEVAKANVEEREDLTKLRVELEKKREKLRIVEVQSQVNLPDVRWKVSNAMVDMSLPGHRHLVEKKWRSDGDLDLLMERLHQMHVIPDVLPDLRPTIDVHVVARTTLRERVVSKKLHTTVEPGTFLVSEQTIKPPNVYANVFHTDTRLYTMLLVDPDVPDEESQSFHTFLHWLKPNIPLSASTRTRIDLTGHTPYLPPHPQQGTPYHRYVLLLLPQPPLHPSHITYPLTTEANAAPGVPTSVHLDIPPVLRAERNNFDVRAFVKQWGLDQVPGGGAHMWREVWDYRVSEIYKKVLKEPEPRFGRPPKEDRYLEYKQRKRYV